MQLIRYRAGGGAPQVGILDGDRVRPLPGVATMADLLARPVTWIRGACETLLAGGTLDPGDDVPGGAVPGGAAPEPGSPAARARFPVARRRPARPRGPARIRSRCGELPCWPPWTGKPRCGRPG